MGLSVSIRFKWNYRDVDDQLCQVYSDWFTLQSDRTLVELNDAFASLFGEATAYYEPNSTLVWEFKVDDEPRGEFATSANPLYVTYKSPINYSDGIFHTVLHIGCVAADEAR